MAIFQVQEENGQKKLVPMTGGVPDGSVGSLIMKYKKIQPKNCLYCDGRDTTGTDEELRIYYPALYMYLGSNVLPDYRECTFVGAEQNTTDTIATHDVYAQGQFKDDQLKDHTHGLDNSNTSGSTTWVLRNDKGFGGNIQTGGAVGSRIGSTTHGKQKAVYVYIVAVDSVVVSDDESFLRVVENYIDEKNSYSETETLTGGKWIDGKPIYRKVVDFGALPNATTKSVAHGISNLGKAISLKGIAYRNTTTIPLPYPHPSTPLIIGLYLEGANVAVIASSDRSNFTSSYVIIEYTKTT